MVTPVSLPVSVAENYSVIELEPFDEQGAANTAIDVASALVFSFCDLISVQGFEIRAGFNMFFEDAY